MRDRARVTTSLSGRAGTCARDPRGTPRPLALARASLVLVPVALLSSSCLVTSTPRLEDPRQTPIILKALNPDIRVPYVLMPDQDAPRFQFQVRSEDAGVQVRLEAVIDFGFPGKALNIPFYTDTLDPGHIDDLGRVPIVPLSPTGLNVGCHTVTVLAAHKIVVDGGTASPFDKNYCPTQLNDSARLTWIVNFCTDPASCASLPLQGPGACPMTADFDPCSSGPDAGTQ